LSDHRRLVSDAIHDEPFLYVTENLSAMAISIIIPVLDEQALIQSQLEALGELRSRGVEVIVADGGSMDGTMEIAKPLADRVISAPRGRASQMNAGAQLSKNEILLFLHVDTFLPSDADLLVENMLASSERVWGRLDVRIVPASPVLNIVAWMMNLRSRWSGIGPSASQQNATERALRAIPSGSYRQPLYCQVCDHHR
jgi:glycosyltransferase involved in cell wall biosynthesis